MLHPRTFRETAQSPTPTLSMAPPIPINPGRIPFAASPPLTSLMPILMLMPMLNTLHPRSFRETASGLNPTLSAAPSIRLIFTHMPFATLPRLTPPMPILKSILTPTTLHTTFLRTLPSQSLARLLRWTTSSPSTAPSIPGSPSRTPSATSSPLTLPKPKLMLMLTLMRPPPSLSSQKQNPPSRLGPRRPLRMKPPRRPETVITPIEPWWTTSSSDPVGTTLVKVVVTHTDYYDEEPATTSAPTTSSVVTDIGTWTKTVPV